MTWVDGAQTLSTVGIQVLGPMEVDSVRALGPRDRIALGVLVVCHGHAVHADEFAAALWPDGPPASWAKQIHICIGRIRQAIGASAIETTSAGYRLGSIPVTSTSSDSSKMSHTPERCGWTAKRSGLRSRSGGPCRCGEVARSKNSNNGPQARPRPLGSRSCGAPSRKSGWTLGSTRESTVTLRCSALVRRRRAAAGASVGNPRTRAVPMRPTGRCSAIARTGAAHTRRTIGCRPGTGAGGPRSVNPQPGSESGGRRGGAGAVDDDVSLQGVGAVRPGGRRHVLRTRR